MRRLVTILLLYLFVQLSYSWSWETQRTHPVDPGSNDGVTAMVADDQYIYYGGNDKLWKSTLDGTYVEDSSVDPHGSSHITKMYISNNGDLFLSQGQRIYRYNKNLGYIQHVDLSGNIIDFVAIDSGNTIKFYYASAGSTTYQALRDSNIANTGFIGKVTFTTGTFTGNSKIYPNSGTTSVFVTSYYDTVGSKVYFAGGFGALVEIQTSNDAATLRDLKLTSAITALGGGRDGAQLNLFPAFRLGTSGLLSKVVVDGTNYNLNGIIFIPQIIDTISSFEGKSIFVGSRAPTTSSSGRIYRIDISSFSPFLTTGGQQYHEVFSGVNFGSSLILPTLNFVTFGRYYTSGSGSTLNRIEVMNIADCFGGCQTCKSSDDLYCGFCLESQEETAKWGALCSPQSLCATVFDDNPENACGNIESVSPSEASTDGSTVITITGNIDFPNTAKCKFRDVTYEGVVLDNTITCSDTSKQEGAAGEIVEVTVDINGAAPIEGRNITLYDCSALSCSTCSSKPDCGWCYFTGSCTGTAECADSGVSNWEKTLPSNPKCPKISSFKVTTAISTAPKVHYQGEEITVTTQGTLVDISGAPLGQKYACFVEGSFLFEATRVNENTLTCNTSLPGGLNNREPYSLQIAIVDNALAFHNLYTQESVSIEFYDCEEVTVCGDCSDLERCSFCGSGSPYCVLDQGECGATCPIISSLSSSLDEIDGGTEIFVNVAFLDPGDYKCRFVSKENGNTIDQDAQMLSEDQYSCFTPQVSIANGLEYSISMFDSNVGQELTSRVSFNFYSCIQQVTCDDCFSFSRCSFFTGTDEFVTGGSCDLNNVVGPGKLSDGSNCPVINVTSTDSYNILGGGTIILNVVPLPFNGTDDAFCNFNDIIVPVTSVDWETKTVTCTIPPSEEGTVDLYLSSNGGTIPLISPITFEFYDCTDFTTCESCIVENSACKWCKGECINPDQDDGCASGLTSVCPNITGIDGPIPVVTDGSVFQLLSISAFENDIIADLSCRLVGSSYLFNDQGVDNVDGLLYCEITPDIPEGIYDVYLDYLGTPYASGSASLKIYECSSGDCGDQCFNEPNCVWCVINGTCTPRIYCDQVEQSEQCAALSVQPDFSGIGGNDILEITISGMDISSLSNIMCNFDSVIVVPQSIQGTVLKCKTPALAAGFRPLTLEYNDNAFSRVADIEFVDCSTITGCTACSEKAHCGWCLHDNKCTLEKVCGAPKIWVENECPTLISISPNNLTVLSTDNITVTGTHFIDYNLQIQLSPNPGFNNITYIDENTFIFTLLEEWTTVGNLEVILFSSEGDIYAINQIGFTVNPLIKEPPTEPPPSFPIWVIIIIVIVIILVLVGIFGAIFFFTKKGDSLELVEPDYEALAFGEDMERFQWVNPPDNYSLFEEYLIREKKKVIFTSFISVIGSADLDRAAKSFVYILEAEGFTLDFFIYVIGLEIDSSTTPNTIFRGNSLASKMFKTYCRMTAVPYLFDIIAQFIQPLEQLQQREQNTKGDDNQVEMDLLNVNIEVDDNKGAGEDLEANSYQLELLCNRILNAILKSTDSMPMELRKIFAFVKQRIYEKFADEDEDTIYYAIGGLIFLRFVVPSITAPHVYGLLPNPPSPETQRQLILIGKVIQSIGNMVEPGKKEKFMLLLSDYIQSSIPKVKDFYELISVEGGNPERRAVPVSEIVRLNALSELYTIFVGKDIKMKEVIEQLAEEQDFDPLPYLRKVENIVETYGNEFPQKVKKKKKK